LVGIIEFKKSSYKWGSLIISSLINVSSNIYWRDLDKKVFFALLIILVSYPPSLSSFKVFSLSIVIFSCISVLLFNICQYEKFEKFSSERVKIFVVGRLIRENNKAEIPNVKTDRIFIVSELVNL